MMDGCLHVLSAELCFLTASFPFIRQRCEVEKEVGIEVGKVD
jgi:hypothetical protein